MLRRLESKILDRSLIEGRFETVAVETSHKLLADEGESRLPRVVLVRHDNIDFLVKPETKVEIGHHLHWYSWDL